MIKPPGAQATRSQQILLAPLFESEHERVIIHHVTEDSSHRLQLEIERHVNVYGKKSITFERVVL